jgi:hypothetical protein
MQLMLSSSAGICNQLATNPMTKTTHPIYHQALTCQCRTC